MTATPTQSSFPTPRTQRVRGSFEQQTVLKNVSPTERLISVTTGTGLIYAGLKLRSTLGLGSIALGALLLQRGVTGHCALYHSLNINTRQKQPAAPEEYFTRGTQACCVITINKSPAELYRFWRDLANIPKVLKTVKRVEQRSDRVSHWVVEGIGGREIEWDAEIINDEPDHLIAWRSLADADVAIAGSVRFLPTPQGQGTEMHVVLDYIPPAGKLGVLLAKVLGKDAQSQLQKFMRSFKRMMEFSPGPVTS